jgi:hypothetical protein
MHRTFISACRILLAAAPVCAIASPAAAQEPVVVDSSAFEEEAPSRGPAVGLVLEMGLDYGGDPVATVTYEDNTYQEITGGEGLAFGVGGEIRPSAGSPFAVRGTVGFKYNMSNASNASITLTRIPIRLIASYEVSPGVTVGGGLVHHTAVQFNGDNIGPDMEFDDATGAEVELAWNGIGLAYTSMRYTDEDGVEYDASNIGLIFTYTFGSRKK